MTYFRNDPVGFIEHHHPAIKLSSWQKEILNKLAEGNAYVKLPKGGRENKIYKSHITETRKLYDEWKNREADTKSI